MKPPPAHASMAKHRPAPRVENVEEKAIIWELDFNIHIMAAKRP